MLYYLDKNEKTNLEKVREVSPDRIAWKEKDLENLLVEHIDKLVRNDQLFVIAKERQMQAEADIMALDEKGVLYLFELKRWKSNKNDLLQVLRYGQRFGQYDYKRLNNLFQSYIQKKTPEDISRQLNMAHKEYFDLDNPLEPNQFNLKQRFVIVTNGLDVSTWDAIQYWKSYDLPVDALIYRIYESKDNVMIDFDPFGPVLSAPNSGESGLYVVNTNKTYDPEAYRDMLEKNKASAYGDRRHSITGIPKNAPVCLYHVGVGVIAIGKATDTYQISHDNPNDVEFFVPCKFDYKVDPDKEPEKAVPAWEINQKFGTGHRFRLTVFNLNGEYAKFIQKRFKERAEAAKNKSDKQQSV